ncbi:MAG: hypothetical protein JW867_05965 [Candidatus Omnitrophica bacterium]|nr:hypothetical protein [Candidatus Omnitrophota bacterium]
MKILLINSLGPKYGSTVRSRIIFKALKELGEDVWYVESNSDLDDINVFCISQANNILSFLLASLRRAWLCFRGVYDLYIIAKITPLTIFSIVTLKLMKKKFIVDCDDLDSEFQSTNFRKKISSFLEKKVPRRLPRITTHNNYLTYYLRSYKAREVNILPQCIDTDIFDPGLYDPEKIVQAKGLRGKIILTFLCTFTEGGMRDIDLILEALKKITVKIDNTHLFFIGGGLLQEAFREKLKEAGIDDYSITGFIPQKEVAELLAISNICLIYMRDNLGNKMRVSFKTLEYLSMNKKVIGCLTGYTKDALGEFCTLSNFNPQSLSQEIIKAIDSKDFSAKPHAREHIIANFSYHTLKEKLREIIDSYR